MKKKIIVNVNHWQTRIAILRGNELQNVYFASPQTTLLERTFFKGVISKVLPGIQTAFVDIGQDRPGFLHISEIDRELALERMSGSVDLEYIGKEDAQQERQRHSRNLDMSKILHQNEEILVQVSKEPVYEKGPKLTTCFTLPGRFIVLLPNIPRIAISKKIDAKEERARLKEIVFAHLPQGMGAIIRTTSDGRPGHEIAADITYLVNTWQTINESYKKVQPREKVHEDFPLILQMVRDHLDDDVETVIIDDKNTEIEVYKFVKLIAPEYTQKIHYYAGPQNIFEKYNIEKQIQDALKEKVDLPSGGSIIIQQTHAMTVVDVNTGKNTGKHSLQETILETNLEAAEEIVRQLRLRNIGGLIVIDFIDMDTVTNRQKLIRFFEKILKERDKFQSLVLKVSELGLVEMTRKRTGLTLLQTLENTCTTCCGLGFIKTIQTICYEMFHKIGSDLRRHKNKAITIAVNDGMFNYIINNEYNTMLAFQKEYDCKITLAVKEDLKDGSYVIE